jgi:cyclophilin family peptidyl-prolyl cis-trans isomerase
MYAARAAMAMSDEGSLDKLVQDPNPNVTAAALLGLAKIKGHSADALYIVALSRLDNQIGVAAGRALLDTKEPAAAPALLKALAQYTALKKDNTRDARVAILRALKSTGLKAEAEDLRPYLHDFDPAVATLAASTLSAWTGDKIAATPMRPPATAPHMAQVLKLNSYHLRITMKCGGVFEIELFPDQAPATVERMVGLTKAGYFNGLTLHRWAPNWVIQGGSPSANEVVGDSPFMNDEVGLLPHKRGSVGISTRGHDTGDAQLFVDLNDNDRLDHGYTVWGSVVTGMDVVDTVMEADVMQKVEIVPTAGPKK